MSLWNALFGKKNSGNIIAPSELISAVTDGDLKEVVTLIQNNPKLARSDADEHSSLLYLAVEQGRPEVVAILLANKADVSAGRRARTLQMPRGRNYLMEASAPIILAASEGHTEILKLLLAYGADVNSKGDGGQTPLHAATAGGHKDAVAMLISNGADVNAKDFNHDRSPLHLVESREIASLLLNHGADINATNRYGYSALALCSERGDTELADLLKQLGAADIRDSSKFEDEIKDVLRKLSGPSQHD